MSITVYVRRNSDLGRIGEIDDYMSLKLVLKFNEPSKWELVVSNASPLASQLGSATGIIVERDGTVILSGPVESTIRNWDESGDRLIVLGSDDSVYLSRRIVFPGVWTTNAFDAAYDTATDNAETLMHYYVNKNAGPGADADRRVAGLVMGADNAAGSVITAQGRLQQLDVFLSELALAGGDLRFQLVQVGSTVEFQVVDPADLTDSVQFSPDLGNLASFSYERSGPIGNFIYVGGPGVGVSRTFRRDGDSPSIAEWLRSESFKDRRDVTTVAQLDQTIAEELAATSETVNLSIKPIDIPAITYGVHYNLGDRVRVITPSGTQIEDAIRELTITYAPETGEVIEPVVGTPGATQPRKRAIYKKRKYQEKRTRDLERV